MAPCHLLKRLQTMINEATKKILIADLVKDGYEINSIEENEYGIRVVRDGIEEIIFRMVDGKVDMERNLLI